VFFVFVFRAGTRRNSRNLKDAVRDAVLFDTLSEIQLCQNQDCWNGVVGRRKPEQMKKILDHRLTQLSPIIMIDLSLWPSTSTLLSDQFVGDFDLSPEKDRSLIYRVGGLLYFTGSRHHFTGEIMNKEGARYFYDDLHHKATFVGWEPAASLAEQIRLRNDCRVVALFMYQSDS
jgi:hypothetical protein